LIAGKETIIEKSRQNFGTTIKRTDVGGENERLEPEWNRHGKEKRERCDIVTVNFPAREPADLMDVAGDVALLTPTC